MSADRDEAVSDDDKQFFVYVLGSRSDAAARTYVGWTTVLERRLQQHNSGTGAKSTRGRQWIVLYSEQCETRSAAMSREWYLKRDRAFRKTLLKTFLAAMLVDAAGNVPSKRSAGV
jgi:putative endonuclease